MMSERARKAVAFAIFVLGLAAIVALLSLTRGCGEKDRADQAVAIDRTEASRDAYEKGMIAERAATANQTAAEAAFANEQDKADDKIDDAARRRVSPLDELFGGMR